MLISERHHAQKKNLELRDFGFELVNNYEIT